MAEMFEIETIYNGYKVRALPYYLRHEDALRVLVSWEAWGGDLILMVDLLFVNDKAVIYGLYGHTESPEKVIPKVTAYAETVLAKCTDKALIRWMGETDALVETWKAHNREKLEQAARDRETLDAA